MSTTIAGLLIPYALIVPVLASPPVPAPGPASVSSQLASPRATPAPSTAPAADPELERRTAAVEFVERYERAVNVRDVDSIRAAINGGALIDRAQEGIELNETFRRGFRDGALDGFDWGTSLVAGLGPNGHYRLLRMQEKQGAVHALLRLVNGDGGVNYHDIELAQRDDGTFEIVDVYVFLSGERLSDTVRRSLMQFIAAVDRGDDDYVQSYAAVGAMAQLVQAGRFAEAHDLYDQLPANLRGDKMVMLLRVQSASQLDDASLDRACSDFRRLYPNDPCIDLLTLDQLIIREQWDEALASIERMQEQVGPDAYLDDLTANVLLQRGSVAEAKRAAQRAIDREPTLDEGHWTLLEIALAEKDHAETARLLTLLEGQFGWVFDGVNEAAAYRAFVQSQEFEQWNATRRVTTAE